MIQRLHSLVSLAMQPLSYLLRLELLLTARRDILQDRWGWYGRDLGIHPLVKPIEKHIERSSKGLADS